MKRPQKPSTLCGPVLSGVLAGLLFALPAPPANADDEIRAGAVLQIPFDLNARSSFFDPAAIRIGLTCQYADVEEDEIVTHRYITDHYSTTPPHDYLGYTLTNSAVRVDEGDRVMGVEGNLFVEVFNGWNGSAELLGFYGNNEIQGALGAGYSLSDAFFLDAKAMFPYTEIGMRFLGPLEIYGGVKTLGDFQPAKERRMQDHRTTVYDDITPP